MGMARRNLISKKKSVYPIDETLRGYLERYGRLVDRGIRYQDLHRFHESTPLYDEHGTDTLWVTVFYPHGEMREIHEQLRMDYALLKAAGDTSVMEHLYIDRVDLCLYGNTQPFRVRITNRLNDNYDYFYVKQVDANRIYGLELEHILSPNRINYIVYDNTLIEDHIIGIPGEVFLKDNLPDNRFDRVRLSKEFVKFNERCFVRLLGDMHSGNFVVDISRDFEKWHFRLRPIDFDQQSHHWRKQVYLPQYYHNNNDFVFVGMQCMTPATMLQYQREERALIANRMRVSNQRFSALMDVMREDLIAPKENVERLSKQLAAHYRSSNFLRCQTMGDLVYVSLETMREQPQPATQMA